MRKTFWLSIFAIGALFYIGMMAWPDSQIQQNRQLIRLNKQIVDELTMQTTILSDMRQDSLHIEEQHD